MVRVLLTVLALGSAAAHAKIVVVRSSGERIEPLGLVTVNQRDAVRALTSMGAIQVGYVFDFDALYTLDLWSSNGRYCLFMDRQYWTISEAQAAQFLGRASVEPPLSYRFPIGLVSLTIVGLLGLLLATFGKRLADFLERKFPPEPR